MALAQPLTRGTVQYACSRPHTAEAVVTRDDLSALERTVIGIGAIDARQGLRIGANSGRRMERIVRLLLGRRSPATLADPRLEALRRFAHVASQARERIDDIRRVRDAGFNPAQIVLAARLSREALN